MISVWLKVRMRDSLDSVLKCLNFWLAAFDNKEKYKIYIYSENIDLPPEYLSYPIVRRHDLIANVNCRKVYEQIQKNHIANHWRPAAFALSAPYFYIQDTNLVYNIDADDIIILGPIKNYLTKVEEAFNDNRIFTLSYDMHYSCHQGDYYPVRPHHWTFGVNLSRVEQMRELILKQLFTPIPAPPWGVNIDYIIDYKLDSVDTPYVCFITPNQLIHYISGDYNQNKFSKFEKTANKVETKLYGRTQYVDKHSRTLFIE